MGERGEREIGRTDDSRMSANGRTQCTFLGSHGMPTSVVLGLSLALDGCTSAADRGIWVPARRRKQGVELGRICLAPRGSEI